MDYYFTMTTDFHGFVEEAKQMMLKHNDEVDLFDLPLDISYDIYEHYFNDNSFVIFEMRSATELVGYCGFFIYPHLHHKTSLHAKQDILFIKKKNRGHGLKFIKYCDEKLKEIGIHYVLQCVPAQRDWSSILKRVGYHKLETVYTRRL